MRISGEHPLAAVVEATSRATIFDDKRTKWNK